MAHQQPHRDDPPGGKWVLRPLKHDAFHFMLMLDRFLPTGWPHRAGFYKDLSSAIYLSYPDDEASVAQLCQSAFKCSLEDILGTNKEWVWARVRRQIPKPVHLHANLEDIFWAKWSKVLNENGTAPLFGKDAEHVFKTMLAMVDADLISDPPGVELYSVLKTDGDGLKVYSCRRWPSGEVQTYKKTNEVLLRDKSCSVELADKIAAERMAVDARKEDVRRGRAKDCGHYNEGLTDRINQLYFEIWGEYEDPDYVPSRNRQMYY